jgi:hypothetical protein
VFFLAQRRLSCYPQIWDWAEIVQEISIADGKKIKPEYVKKFWQDECRPVLGKIARVNVFEYREV